MNILGTAYAFFKCNSSEESIRKEIPHIREIAGTPKELDLFLFGDIEHFIKTIKNDLQLLEIAVQAKMSRKYALQAKLPYFNNRAAADSLADILNQMYNTQLFEDKEPFFGEIVYKERDEYIFRDV